MDALDLSTLERAITGLPAARPKMNIFEATMIAEGNFEIAGYEPSEELSIEAWQLLIDTGTVWQLQGSFGRQAVALIEAGVCSR